MLPICVYTNEVYEVCNIENIHVMLILCCFAANYFASYSGNLTDFKLKFCFIKLLYKMYLPNFSPLFCSKRQNSLLPTVMITNENIKKINHVSIFRSFRVFRCRTDKFNFRHRNFVLMEAEIRMK